DLVGVVDLGQRHVLRDAALADALGNRRALGLQLAALEPAVHCRAHRIGDGDAHLRTLLLQVAADAGERAAGADGAGEAVYLAAGLLPDLGAGAAIVAIGVRRVVPLVRPEGAEFFRDALRHVHIVVRILVRHRRHFAQLGAAKAQHVLLLLALRFGNYDQRAITARIADECESDAGVARGAFDDQPAALEDSALLGIEDQI